jgi:hypothetical protein
MHALFRLCCKHSAGMRGGGRAAATRAAPHPQVLLFTSLEEAADWYALESGLTLAWPRSDETALSENLHRLGAPPPPARIRARVPTDKYSHNDMLLAKWHLAMAQGKMHMQRTPAWDGAVLL